MENRATAMHNGMAADTATYTVPNPPLPAFLILRALFGQVPIAGAADQGRDDPAPLVAEGPLDGDWHVPPRFFSWRTDEQLLGFMRITHDPAGHRQRGEISAEGPAANRHPAGVQESRQVEAGVVYLEFPDPGRYTVGRANLARGMG